MTSIAMISEGQTPGTLNKWLIANGGYVAVDRLVWSSVSKFGKLTFLGLTDN